MQGFGKVIVYLFCRLNSAPLFLGALVSRRGQDYSFTTYNDRDKRVINPFAYNEADSIWRSVKETP